MQIRALERTQQIEGEVCTCAHEQEGGERDPLNGNDNPTLTRDIMFTM